MKQLVRAAAGIAPRLGLVTRPDARAFGVSALVRMRDEADWIEASLRSLEGFADEAIVVDNGSTDGSPDIVRALAGRLALDVRLAEVPTLDHEVVSNEALDRARFRWLIRWDADFVAHTAGRYALRGLRDVLAAEPAWRHACIHPALVEVAGDLFHRRADLAVRYDSHVLTSSPALRYRTERSVRDAAGRRLAIEFLRVPVYYAIRRWDVPAIFHVNVKPAARMLRRHFWQEWWSAGTGQSLEHYVRERAAERWGTADLDAAAHAFVVEYCHELVPFDPTPYGGYPELLAPALTSPTYRVVYDGARPAGRTDVRRART